MGNKVADITHKSDFLGNKFRSEYGDSKAQTPDTPDYVGAAKATAIGNIEAARVAAMSNRTNQYTPYGSLVYTQDSKNPDLWTSTTTLSEDQQKLLDQNQITQNNLAGLQTDATGRLSSALSSPYAETYDPSKATNSATDQIMSRLAPQFAREQSSLESQLANQGIQRGSEAWNNAMTDLSQQKNDAYNQAALQGINLGMSQQGQTYNQQTANRSQPINELNALLQGSQVTNPQFTNTPQQATTGGANYLGAAQSQAQSDMNSYNAKVGQQNSMQSGLLGLAGAAAMYF